MSEVIVVVMALLLLIGIINLVLLLRKKPSDNSATLVELKFQLEAMQNGLIKLEQSIRMELAGNREELGRNFKENRTELGASSQLLSENMAKKLDGFANQLQSLVSSNGEKFTILNNTVVEQLNSFKAKMEQTQQLSREELVKMQTVLNTITDTRLNAIRDTIDLKLKSMQEENGLRLEEMRKTVDEKLQESVEKRFTESFKNISERLDQVHKGLGEMQTLATGVGDLKKVLTNVKTRGVLGEIQLAAILEQCLAPDQYVVNAAVKEGSGERVEFAIKMPGRGGIDDPAVLLPIDSKFPVEDYRRLVEVYDNGTPEEIKVVLRAFESTVKKSANDIHNKYINPPITTDFALMFVPTEGLYAEILRCPGLFEHLQHKLKIAIVGPSNLLAFLNSLQMGFRTLAIEKRSGEVWSLLSAVKTEFGRFGDILDKTRNKLESAVKDIDSAGVRSRSIERKLRDIQELPASEATALLEEQKLI